jgi:hypothetical protein
MVKGEIKATSAGSGKTVIIDRKQSTRLAEKYGDSVAKAVQKAAEKGKPVNRTALVALLTTKNSKLSVTQASKEADRIINTAIKTANPFKNKASKMTLSDVAKGARNLVGGILDGFYKHKEVQAKAKAEAEQRAKDDAIRAADENPAIVEMNQKAMKAILTEKLQKKVEQRKKEREIARIQAERKGKEVGTSGTVTNPLKNKSSKMTDGGFTKSDGKRILNDIGTSGYGTMGAGGKVEINEGVKKIEADAFHSAGVNAVTEVKIPNTVKTIGGYAFYDNKIKELTIPASVTSIGAKAFYASSYHERYSGTAIPSKVTFGGTKTKLAKSAFGDSTPELEKAYKAGGAGTYELKDGKWSKVG